MSQDEYRRALSPSNGSDVNAPSQAHLAGTRLPRQPAELPPSTLAPPRPRRYTEPAGPTHCSRLALPCSSVRSCWAVACVGMLRATHRHFCNEPRSSNFACGTPLTPLQEVADRQRPCQRSRCAGATAPSSSASTTKATSSSQFQAAAAYCASEFKACREASSQSSLGKGNPMGHRSPSAPMSPPSDYATPHGVMSTRLPETAEKPNGSLPSHGDPRSPPPLTVPVVAVF